MKEVSDSERFRRVYEARLLAMIYEAQQAQTEQAQALKYVQDTDNNVDNA